MRSPVAELLARVDRATKEISARWYLFGAQAALLYGAARLTADVDVTVDLGERTPEELATAMERAGLQLRFSDRDFVRRRETLELLEQALDRRDLLPELERALRKTRHA